MTNNYAKMYIIQMKRITDNKIFYLGKSTSPVENFKDARFFRRKCDCKNSKFFQNIKRQRRGNSPVEIFNISIETCYILFDQRFSGSETI